MTNVSDILALIWSGAAMTFLGVVAGGLLVYRTKRDSHETFMPRKTKALSNPVNIDDIGFGEEEDMDVVPDMFDTKNRDFLSQLNSSNLYGTDTPPPKNKEAVNVA